MVAPAVTFRAGDLTAAAPRSTPAPLPTAATCPAPRCFLEVVRHPAGGWTIAAPLDASSSSARIYRGRYLTRPRAQAALDELF